MRTALLTLCLLGLAMGVMGQTTVAPQTQDTHSAQLPTTPVLYDTVPPTAMLKCASFSVDMASAVMSRVVAKNVEIQMGDNVLVADEATIQYQATGDRDDVELRGNVHLKAKVRVN
jgi:hypothetical protein